jgi:hypothetical protein
MLATSTIYLQKYNQQEINVFYQKYPECTEQTCSDKPDVYLKGVTYGIFVYYGWVLSIIYILIFYFMCGIIRMFKKHFFVKN